jgi:hypothetical protein
MGPDRKIISCDFDHLEAVGKDDIVKHIKIAEHR